MEDYYIFWGIVIILLLWIIGVYNAIVQGKNAVERSWAGVITQERQKNKILPELEKLVKEYKDFEGNVLEEISRLRSGMSKLSSDKIDPQLLSMLETQTNTLLNGIRLQVENYPELKASEIYTNLMKELTEQQENIGAALRIFNQNVEAFNNLIQVFPNNLINKKLNKEEKIAVFYDSEAQSGFEYQPAWQSKG